MSLMQKPKGQTPEFQLSDNCKRNFKHKFRLVFTIHRMRKYIEFKRIKKKKKKR